MADQDRQAADEDGPSPRLVSVVVPAYNAERFLSETVACALAQTHRAIEVLVIDDGSTDRTRAIAEEWSQSDPRVRVVSGPNRGLARARNRGIELARGEFVAFLDADDLWHPRKIALQLAELERGGEDWAACYALSRILDEDGRVIANRKVLAPSGYIYARHLLGRFVGNGSALLVRRSAARAIGGFDPDYAARGLGGCEDFDFELRLAARYRIASVPQYLVGYRLHSASMSADRTRMVKSFDATIRAHLETGPPLPAWVRRQAMALVSSYAISAEARARRPLRAGLAALALMSRDPTAGWYRLAGITRRVMADLTGRAGQGPAEQGRRPFAAFGPEDGLAVPPPAFAARRAARGEAVDDGLLRRRDARSGGEMAAMAEHNRRAVRSLEPSVHAHRRVERGLE